MRIAFGTHGCRMALIVLLFAYVPLRAQGDEFAVYGAVWAQTNGGPANSICTGTYCKLGWGAMVTGDGNWPVYPYHGYNYITNIDVYMNGDHPFSMAFPDKLYYRSGNFYFDSTRFQDGSTIDLEMIVTLQTGDAVWVSGSALVYNKAYIFGNQTPNTVPGGIGELLFGYRATTAVTARSSGTSHTILPAGNKCTQLRGDILGALPVATVFYAWTHGTPDAYGDSAAFDADTPGSPRFIAHWITTLQTYQAITDAGTGKMAINAPPYNLVFFDSCLSAGGNYPASFQIDAGSTDRAYLGYDQLMGDTEHNVNWTNRLFDRLAAGWTLSAAIDYANSPPGSTGMENWPQAADLLHSPVDVTRIGDGNYKLHWLYGSDPGVWFR